MMNKKFVYLFTEGDGSMRELLGGKGANLAEMTNIGMPVPQGFTITTEACTQYYEDGRMINDEIKAEILEYVTKLEVLEGLLAEAKVEGQFGFEFEGKTNLLNFTGSSDERHECVGCVAGSLSVKLQITPSVTFLKSEKLKYSIQLVNGKWTLFEFYACVQHGKADFGKCPDVAYMITVTAEDAFLPAHAPSGGVGVLRFHGDHLVNEVQIQNFRDEVGADALDAVGTADAPGDQGGVGRLRTDDTHLGVFLP